MELPRSFRERLALARRRKRWSQEQLGVFVGTTGATIGRLERGLTTSVDYAVLRRLARALEVNLDWLLAMDVPGEDTADTLEDAEDLIATPHA